ncbi:bifunctional 2-polyprenyl-6-hydroxyphenol methylase/3-demethylubiquinol 3-O-methyltransferase UbiG [Acetobacterium wieringae]|uniref:class I SAM-dependent methyltransferase n=1 Tax=Acetobacterium wieringae TaxID=52694 RepID=UPI0026EFD254|nr:class I SAM-dependent methyltransferase [Acetobacterium wieringae]
MNITEIIKTVGNPKPYDNGTDLMWDDKHISKFLLEAHINPEIGVASRTSVDIDNTVEMINTMIPPESKILDLGCGPGLYAERLSKKGHRVTGVDISKNSIDYAIAQREKNHSAIEYINGDYLKLEIEGEFDFVMMIYCDFGVLVPEERLALIKKIQRFLKPGGVFFFDAIDEDTIKRLNFNSSWEMSEGGFWKPDPYICLSKNFHFKEKKATLDQHLVIGEDDFYKLYRFWNHYFNQEDIEKLFIPNGFSKVESFKNILTGSEPYNDHGVVFYAVSK